MAENDKFILFLLFMAITFIFALCSTTLGTLIGKDTNGDIEYLTGMVFSFFVIWLGTKDKERLRWK